MTGEAVDVGPVHALRVEYLDGSLLADPVADLSGVDPYGQVSWQVLHDVGHWVARLPGRPVEHGVGWVGDLEASECGSLEWLVRVPVVSKLVPEG